MGGNVRYAQGVTAFALTALALALFAGQASATTDRADYASQANAICKSGNAQQKQLIDTFEQTQRQLDARAKKVRGKKRRKIQKRAESLFDQLPGQSLAIFGNEVAQLTQVPAAPGDEGLVSDWISGRVSLVDLVRQSNAIELRIEHLYDNVVFRSPRGFRKLDRKEKRLQRQANSLYQQIRALSDRDLELGTELGATYCVTGATGTLLSAGLGHS
jgi:hypothetical protein